MNKPLISKIRCLSPNKKSTAIRNYNLLYYIATREGVDLQPLEQELKSFKNDMSDAAENETYIKYINERPRSNGLFGNIDTNDVNAVCKYLKKISNRQCVFRGIVSLSQEDAEELNFTSKENWAKFLHENLPDIGEKLGISSNDLTWVAAYHNEQGHPHVHYMLWSEAKEQHIKPYISIPQQHQCRELLSKQMFKQEREMYMHLKTNFRDLLTKSTREDIRREIELLKQEVFGLPEYRTLSRINNQLLSDSTKKLLELAEAIPLSGSMKYRYMPPEIKEKINLFVGTMLSKYELQDEYKKFLRYSEQMALTYSSSEKKQQVTLVKAKKDIDSRLGNIVLKAIKDLQKNKNLYFSVIDKKSEIELHPLDNVGEFDLSGQEFDLSSSLKSDSEHFYRNGATYIKWSEEYKTATDEFYSDLPDFDKVIELLDGEHQKGNILATYELGKIHERNLSNSNLNPDLATTYYQEALSGFQSIYNIKQNQSFYAAYRIGKMFQYGQGIEKNLESAKSWYEKAENNAYAQYALAKILMSESRANKDLNHSSLIVNLLKNSSKKNFYASYELGRIYQEGLFDKQNSDLSQRYYKQAFDGFSEMLRKSEKNDDLLYRLGKMYQLGLGTDVDIEQATILFEKAAVLKNINALYSLSKIYMQSNDEELLKKAINILNELYEINPENDLVLYALGSAYSYTQSENYDINKAIKFLEHAAELGNDFALFKLGNIYSEPAEKHPELPVNIPLALTYLEKSAGLGNNLAMYSMGKIFSDIDSEHYDIHKAIRFLEQSASLGNDFAMLKLGNIYLWGKGVPQDKEKGIYWLDKSAASGNEYAEQSKQAYDTFEKEKAMQQTFSLFGNLLKSLCYSNNKARTGSLYTDKSIKGNKKALRENARKNPYKHSHLYDTEI